MQPLDKLINHEDPGWPIVLDWVKSAKNKVEILSGWNKSKDCLLIDDNAAGGFFILNGGGLGSDLGKVYYFSPDNLNYEPLDRSYSEFLDSCFNGDLNKFYDGLRWKDWETEVSKLNGDQVFNFFPFLWTDEGQDINKCTRKAVPVEEQYSLNMDLRKQI